MQRLNPAMAFGLVLMLVACSIKSVGQLMPVTLTASSYNRDVVAESGSNPAAVTTSGLDGPNGNVLYSVNFRTVNSSVIDVGGLPDNGTIINGGDTWQMAPYNGNNILYFGPQSSATTQSLYLAAPSRYMKLSLMAAAGYGAPTFGAVSSISVSLHFVDNSSTSYGTYAVVDWFYGGPAVINSIGRIVRATTVAANNAPSGNPYIHQYDISLNATDASKTVDRIDIKDLSNNNQATIGIFAVSGISSVLLPVTISGLTTNYQAAANIITLGWNAGNVNSTESFVIERSGNGVNFDQIGTIPAGPALMTNHYSFIDRNILSGQSYYYRISQVQTDGTIYYSLISKVQTQASTSLAVSCADGILHVTGNQGGQSLQYAIFSSSGQLWLRRRGPAASNFDIDVQSLKPGLYFLQIGQGNQPLSFKFMKL